MTPVPRLGGEVLTRGTAVAVGSYGLLAAMLLTGRTTDYPDLHTVLDTAVCLLSGMLTALLWAVGARSDRTSVRRLALGFGATSLLELFHAVLALSWQAAGATIASEAQIFRPSSWPPPAYLLPLSIIAVHALERHRRISSALFGSGLVLAGGALLGISFVLPPYVPGGLLGVTRPFLVGVPLLWLVAVAWSWTRRADRMLGALVPTAALMLVGHSFMLFSRSPHDAMAMVAHLGKVFGLLLFIGHLMQMGVADMQQRIAAECALREVNEELAEQYGLAHAASRLKSEFLANMSHELRTPLNAIIGFAELLHDGKVGPVRADQKEFLGDILGSSRHLLQLINDVLDLSKVEAGKMEFHPEHVDVGKLVGDVRDTLRSIAAAKRVRVEVEVDPALGEVVVDPGKLKQVLYNYVSNALKFTPDGGRVTVRAGAEGADRFRLEVEDTGIGIELEDLKRLFTEFQQLDASAAKRYTGTGLGLALTKRLVEAQGGRVWVRSAPGEGSTFFAALPRVTTASRPPKAEAAASVATPASARGLRPETRGEAARGG